MIGEEAYDVHLKGSMLNNKGVTIGDDYNLHFSSQTELIEWLKSEHKVAFYNGKAPTRSDFNGFNADINDVTHGIEVYLPYYTKTNEDNEEEEADEASNKGYRYVEYECVINSNTTGPLYYKAINSPNGAELVATEDTNKKTYLCCNIINTGVDYRDDGFTVTTPQNVKFSLVYADEHGTINVKEYTTQPAEGSDNWSEVACKDTLVSTISKDYTGDNNSGFINYTARVYNQEIENSDGLTVKITGKSGEGLAPTDMTNDTKTGYLDTLLALIDTIPINATTIEPLKAILETYISFEVLRTPSYYVNSDNTTKAGLDKNHDDTVQKVSEKYTKTDGKITTEVDVNGYRWEFPTTTDDNVNNYTHKKLVKDVEQIFHIIASEDTVFYLGAREIVLCMQKYYKQTDVQTVTPVTVEMLNLAELEIYEEEAVYQVHYGNEVDGVVIGLSIDGSKIETRKNTDDNAVFINAFLGLIEEDIKKYLGIGESKDITSTVTDCIAYIKPEDSTPNKTEKDERTKLIEYSQMLNTIQAQRDFIQKGGENKNKFLL